MSDGFQTARLPAEYDALAPDTSEIRLLGSVSRASMVHCTLPPGGVSLAVRHRTVEEIWYCLAGAGEIWRKLGEREEVTALEPGVSVTIPTGAHFRFRATSAEPLTLVIATMPPWPGEAEAARVEDYWET